MGRRGCLSCGVVDDACSSRQEEAALSKRKWVWGEWREPALES